MQQFTVPQFIDVEDKIIGPITTRQFVIILTGAMFIGLSYKMFSFTVFLFVGLLIFVTTGVFAFFRVNGMPFHFFALNFLQTIQKPAVRVWNNAFGKDEFDPSDNQIIAAPVKVQKARSYSQSRLNELSLIVDTRGVYRGEEEMKGANLRVIDEE